MGKTEELYYKSAYISEFDATVTDCAQQKDGKYCVVLDSTAFFPEQVFNVSSGSLPGYTNQQFAVPDFQCHGPASAANDLILHESTLILSES